MQLFKQIRWYFLKQWKQYVGSIFLLIIIAMLQLIPPKIIGILIDQITINKSYENKLLYWTGLILFISILIYILRYMWRILLFGTAYNLAIIIRIKLYNYLSKKNAKFYLKYRTGDLMARATNDVDKVVFAAGEGVLTLIDSIITGLSVLIIMTIYINWKLTIISLIPMPIMTIIITKYGKKLYHAFKKSQKTFSDLNNQTQESLTNIYMIKNFGLEKYEMKKFKKITDNINIKNIIVSKIDAKFDPIIYYSITCSNILTMYTGGYLIWNHSITIGQLTSFMMYLSLMTWPMLALAWMFNIIERGHAAWNRIQNIINKEYMIQSNKKNILENSKNITIEISQFKYPNTIQYALHNISMNIKFNQIIGICGPTGSGKSTLLSLIQRHFENFIGNIFYNNIPIKNYNILHWRNKLTCVHQKTFLFSDTIRNNIAFSNMQAQQIDIENVAKLSNIHQDIINFTNGYETKIGEQGIILSGGQKQRLAISRALLLNTEILILDNALSAIDRLTQYKILKNIISWKNDNHTIVIITNELHILKKTNNIFIMENGSITNQGTHNQLIKYHNWYSTIFQKYKINKTI
ncbi:Multidrug resistance-like ATP-binding protein MdlA [Buchnera aphidicola (Takecallis arundicolens)]|uniref:ABC transporter transmembrane domain-containing protein n=1 Tax=Buchnera aphidicola TaxID=9 RepID=UPI0034639A34